MRRSGRRRTKGSPSRHRDLGQPVTPIEVRSDRHGDAQREPEEEHGDVRRGEGRIPDRGLMPDAILVRPEASHDVENQARYRTLAPDPGTTAIFLLCHYVTL